MRILRFRTLASATLIGCIAVVAAAETFNIPGSGNPEFVLDKLAEAFNAAQSEHRAVIPPSTGTAGALRDVEQGIASIGRVGRPLKPEEQAKGLRFASLGRDPVVFVAGEGVSATTISREQVLAVYTGRIGDWKDLGAAAGPIRAIGRETTDASRLALGRVIGEFGTLSFASAVKVVHLDPQSIDLLERYPTSLGFLNRSALLAAKRRLRILALDGVEATPAHVASGKYPVWLEFGMVYKPEALTAGARAFLRYVESPDGIEILRRHGVVRDIASK